MNVLCVGAVPPAAADAAGSVCLADGAGVLRLRCRGRQTVLAPDAGATAAAAALHAESVCVGAVPPPGAGVDAGALVAVASGNGHLRLYTDALDNVALGAAAADVAARADPSAYAGHVALGSVAPSVGAGAGALVLSAGGKVLVHAAAAGARWGCADDASPAEEAVAGRGLWIGRRPPPAGVGAAGDGPAGPVTVADPGGTGAVRWHCGPAGDVCWSVVVLADEAAAALCPVAPDTSAVCVLPDAGAAAAGPWFGIRASVPAPAGGARATPQVVSVRGPLVPALVGAAVRPRRTLVWDATAVDHVSPDAAPPATDAAPVAHWTESTADAADLVPRAGADLASVVPDAYAYNAFVAVRSRSAPAGAGAVVVAWDASSELGFRLAHPALRFAGAGCLVHPYGDFRANADARADGSAGGRYAPPQLAQCTVYAALCPDPDADAAAMTVLAKRPVGASAGAGGGTGDPSFQVALDLVVPARGVLQARITARDAAGADVVFTSPTQVAAGRLLVVAYRVAYNRLSVFTGDDGGRHSPPGAVALYPAAASHPEPTAAVVRRRTALNGGGGGSDLEADLARANPHPLCLGGRCVDALDDVRDAYRGWIAEVRFHPYVAPDAEVAAQLAELSAKWAPAPLGLDDLTDAARSAATGTLVLGGSAVDSVTGVRNLCVGPRAGRGLLGPDAVENTVVGAHTGAATDRGTVVVADGTGTVDGAALAAVPARGVTWLGPAATAAVPDQTTVVGALAAADLPPPTGGGGVVAFGDGAGSVVLAARPASGDCWVGPGCKRLFSTLTAADSGGGGDSVWLGGALATDARAAGGSVVVADGAGRAVMAAQSAAANAWFGPEARRLFRL